DRVAIVRRPGFYQATVEQAKRVRQQFLGLPILQTFFFDFGGCLVKERQRDGVVTSSLAQLRQLDAPLKTSASAGLRGKFLGEERLANLGTARSRGLHCDFK